MYHGEHFVVYLIVAPRCCMPETPLLDVNYASIRLKKNFKKRREDICFGVDSIAQLCIEYL